MRHQEGFTLIELVIVIVILGLLAASALPRFINVTREARIAAVQGMGGGVSSAASLARAQFMVNGSSGATSVLMDGVPVTVNASGYPTADGNGIQAALQGTQGFTFTPASVPATGTAQFTPTNGGNGTCEVEYTAATGTVVAQSSGCTS